MLLPIPSVAVCVAGRMNHRYLAETVGSVLDQTYTDFELLVVGDGDLDAALASGDPRIRVARADGSAVGAVRNYAVQMSRAPFVKVVCPRDLLHPRCLELQVDAIEADAGLAIVAARHHVIDEESRVRLPLRGLGGLTGVHTSGTVARRASLGGTDPVGPPTGVLFRRQNFLAAGRWRDDRPAIRDLDLWMRLLQYGDLLGMAMPLAATRIERDRPEGAEDQRRALLNEWDAHGGLRLSDRTFGRLGAAAWRARQGLLGLLAGVPGNK